MFATVSCDWLRQNGNSPDTIVLDASLAPAGNKEGFAITACIPGSIRFSIEDISASGVLLPYTLLDSRSFQSNAREAGINKSSRIVVYDTGMYSAPRVWWNFRIMGHQNVFVLNGGISAWSGSGEATAPVHDIPGAHGDFLAKEVESLRVSVDEVFGAIGNSSSKIIDVRKDERYTGHEDEPRLGLRRGHMPSSINIPFRKFLNGSYLRDASQLRAIFSESGCTPGDRLIFSCGSGVTACIGILAAFVSGFECISLYDGSWAEWGANPNLPVAES